VTSPRWLLLIHAIPPEPAYLRVKVRRRLRRLGAVALKNSVYLLPNTEESMEDLRWLAQEIRADGGEATIAAADIVDGFSVDEISARLEDEGHAMPAPVASGTLALGELRARRWVTRAGIKVDRMASAWLIRTRIDPQATFRFATDAAPPVAGEIRFDMYDGEFTHVGDRCTFEVLLAHAGLVTNAPLRTISEIVHDIDCKDARYGRPETAGVSLLIDEIVRGTASDEERLARGAALFESLERAFAQAS
jgi:hypothetical protein